MAATILLELGKGVTNIFAPAFNLAGKGVVSYGDLTNVAGTNLNVASVENSVGWDSNGNRNILLWNYALTGLVPRKVQVARAYMRLMLVSKTVPGGYAYPGWTLNVHEIEPVLAAGATWRLYATGNAWAGDYGPQPGVDYDATPVGSTLISATDFAALPASGTTVIAVVDIDITAAVQRALDEKRNLRLVMPTDWSYPGATAVLKIGNPNISPHATGSHGYLVIEYWPAIGVLSPSETESGRPADFSKLHNPLAAGTSNRTYLDVVEQGTTSAAFKEWAWNFRKTGPRRKVVWGTSRAECDPVDNSGSISGITLKHIQAYDNDTTPTPDTYAPEGKLTVEAVSGTTYRLGYTAPGASITYLLEETTGLTNVTHAADHIFLYNSKWAFKIHTRDWSATTGANTGDRYYTNCRPDQRTTQSTETLGLVEIMPPTPDRFGDAGDTAKARKLSGAYTQQFWAAAADVNISGTTHTHVEVRNTSETGWIVGSPVTLVSADGATIVESTIEVVYSSTDGTYPNQIRLSTQLSAPDLAAMTANAMITGGIFLGDFAVAQSRVLAAAAAVGANTITLVSAFDGTPGEIQIVDSSATPAVTQVVAVTSGTLVLTLAENLAVAFTAGSSVFAIINPATSPDEMSGAPAFFQGDVPQAQDEGLYSGFAVLFERRLV